MTHRPALFAAVLALLAACDAAPRDVRAASPARETVAAPDWSAPRTAEALSAALGVNEHHGAAAAVVDEGGVLHAVFATDRDRDGWADAIDHARMEGGAWSRPERLAASLSLAEAPQVAVDGGGAVQVIWYERAGNGTPREVATEVVRRFLNGGRWSAPDVLYREPHRAGIPGLWLAAARGPGGGVEVLFGAQGKGFGHVTLRGARKSAPAFLDHDGKMPAFAAASAGALEVAYVGEAVSPERPTAENDVFVRSLRGGRWGPRTEAHSLPRRYAHFPQLVVDGRGTRHLFWLEDTNGSVAPEAVFHATSADGARWSAPRDVTPAGLRGGVPMRLGAVAGTDGRIHLAVRHAAPGGAGVGLYAFTVRDGVASPAVALAAPGELGPGDTQLVEDARGRRAVALWRGRDGVYRSASVGL